MRRVAIVGLAPTTVHEAPWDDPEWEFWCLAWAITRRADRYFEPHSYWDTGGYYPNGETREAALEWLSELGASLYMAEKVPELPHSEALPWDDMAALTGKANGQREPYVESTIGAMLAMACLELDPGDKVGLWGVDLDVNGEYAFQRPNAEYYIGFLRGKGVSVFIPRKSALLSTAYPEHGRYGIEQ